MPLCGATSLSATPLSRMMYAKRTVGMAKLCDSVRWHADFFAILSEPMTMPIAYKSAVLYGKFSVIVNCDTRSSVFIALSGVLTGFCQGSAGKLRNRES
jgi:hypothetical protein